MIPFLLKQIHRARALLKIGKSIFGAAFKNTSMITATDIFSHIANQSAPIIPCIHLPALDLSILVHGLFPKRSLGEESFAEITIITAKPHFIYLICLFSIEKAPDGYIVSHNNRLRDYASDKG